MRRRSIASLFVLIASTVFVVSLGSAASAAAVSAYPCQAVSEPPHLVVGNSRLHAEGTFHCVTAATGMTITVCIQEQSSPTAAWWTRACTTNKELESASTVSVDATSSVPVYATYLRATVHGVNDRGETADFATPPVFWFNCACYIG